MAVRQPGGVIRRNWLRISGTIQRSGILSKPTFHLPGTSFAERATHGHVNPDHHTVPSEPPSTQSHIQWPKFPSGRVK